MVTKIHRIRIWDLPTRLFHIALIVCAVGSVATVKAGTLWMDWHLRFGLATAVLITFRIVWGFIGTRYARFGQFVKGPAAVKAYLRGRYAPGPGHNPLGAWSVVAMLALFGFQAFSGLFTTDDILTSGPLAYLNSGWSATLTGLHKQTEWLLYGLVAVHVLAVVWHQLGLRSNIIGSMLHGDIVYREGVAPDAAEDTAVRRLLALLIIAALGFAAWWMSNIGAGADLDFM